MTDNSYSLLITITMYNDTQSAKVFAMPLERAQNIPKNISVLTGNPNGGVGTGRVSVSRQPLRLNLTSSDGTNAKTWRPSSTRSGGTTIPGYSGPRFRTVVSHQGIAPSDLSTAEQGQLKKHGLVMR